jgi:2-polyprenyl-6-methoxyphenol hydroxylase-like FAD-dependent oxidoreductase
MARPRTMVIGGGLSGLCLAHALIAKGAAVTVFERDAGHDIRGQGYRLTIDDTGSEALRACLPQRNYEFIRATAGRAGKIGAFVFLDDRARELTRFSFDLQDRERRGYITGQVDRGVLRQALLSGLEDHTCFGKTFTEYEERPGGVTARFHDGSAAEGDILVGADGVHSRVRRLRLPDAAPRHTGIVGIFGRTPLTRANLPMLGPILASAGTLAMGSRGRVFFCTAMRFRESPAIVAQRFGIAGSSWPSEDYFMWAVAVRQPEGVGNGEHDSSALTHLARQTVDGFHDDFQALVRNADANHTVLVPIRATPPIQRSVPSRVTLIGDAIHTMPPFGAHGANTAFKDAQVFASHFANGVESSRAIEAIGAFEATMQRYSWPIIKSAMRQMTIATVDLPFKREVVRMLVRAASVFSRKAA